jgi:hypothetical protein
MPAISERVDCSGECITAAELCKALVFCHAEVFQTRDFGDSMLDWQFYFDTDTTNEVQSIL